MKAHTFLYHPTLGLKMFKRKKNKFRDCDSGFKVHGFRSGARGHRVLFGTSGSGCRVQGLRSRVPRFMVLGLLLLLLYYHSPA